MVQEIRFRLNSNSEKDKIIMGFLDGEYSPTETIKALVYKMAVGANKGTSLAFWGNVNTVNVLDNQKLSPNIDEESQCKEEIEVVENVNQGEEKVTIDDEIMEFFKKYD